MPGTRDRVVGVRARVEVGQGGPSRLPTQKAGVETQCPLGSPGTCWLQFVQVLATEDLW